jgi:predicted naringenin-chalcone synthase
MRFINAIVTATCGELWSNQVILPHYEQAIDALPIPEPERQNLIDFVRYFLMGIRTRYAVPNWLHLRHFNDHAQAFVNGAEQAVQQLTNQINPLIDAANVVFDAVITTTSTGNLMPGLSYRFAKKLGCHVRSNSMLIDLGNVGCTGSLKALNLAKGLENSFQNILLVSVELPTTLVNWTATHVDIWQGNCTFGDGAAALWISSDPEQGNQALAIDTLHYVQKATTGIDLIRWGYEDYYTFRLADEKTFNHDVRTHVSEALADINPLWLQNPYWAIHPAGIALLMRLARKLGLSREAMQASVAHYDQFSNMSSASILHILKDISTTAPVGTGINLLTMGAGFNVIYGRIRKDR